MFLFSLFSMVLIKLISNGYVFMQFLSQKNSINHFATWQKKWHDTYVIEINRRCYDGSFKDKYLHIYQSRYVILAIKAMNDLMKTCYLQLNTFVDHYLDALHLVLEEKNDVELTEHAVSSVEVLFLNEKKK